MVKNLGNELIIFSKIDWNVYKIYKNVSKIVSTNVSQQQKNGVNYQKECHPWWWLVFSPHFTSSNDIPLSPFRYKSAVRHRPFILYIPVWMIFICVSGSLKAMDGIFAVEIYAKPTGFYHTLFFVFLLILFYLFDCEQQTHRE